MYSVLTPSRVLHAPHRVRHCARSGPGCQRPQPWVRTTSIQRHSTGEPAPWNSCASACRYGQRRRLELEDKVRSYTLALSQSEENNRKERMAGDMGIW